MTKLYAPGTLKDFAILFARHLTFELQRLGYSRAKLDVVKTPTSDILSNKSICSLRYEDSEYLLQQNEKFVGYSNALLISKSPYCQFLDPNNSNIIKDKNLKNIIFSSDQVAVERIVNNHYNTMTELPEISSQTYPELVKEMLTDPKTDAIYIIDQHFYETEHQFRYKFYYIIGYVPMNVVANKLPHGDELNMYYPNSQVRGYSSFPDESQESVESLLYLNRQAQKLFEKIYY